MIGGSPVNLVAPGVLGATIGGGGVVSYLGNSSYTNKVTADFGTVGGGRQNNRWGDATVGGGFQNTCGYAATVPGGILNSAAGFSSFAAGFRAKANHTGAFVWADSTDADFPSTANNQFLIRASGGVGIGTTAPGQLLQVGDQTLASGSEGMMRFGSHSATQPYARYWDIGVPKGDVDISGKYYSFVIDDPQLGSAPEFLIRWDTGFVGIGTTNPVSALQVVGTVTATAFNPPSDRNFKENFAPVSPREVLDKVAAMPISRWNFIGDAATPHVGPMAQDFHAAFGLGTDDKHIATVDADGVALAAIKGLNQKVEVRSQKSEDRMQKLETENAELKQRLEKLEKIILRQKSN